jgi:hypothetical protein
MACLVASVPADEILFVDPSLARERKVVGNVVAESDDGALLVESRDGQQWQIAAEQIRERKPSETPVALYDSEELAEALLEEYGSRFDVHRTKNYVIIYSTSEAFAEESGKLFERIKGVFENYMRRQAGFEPTELRQPMISIIFGSQEEYVRAMQSELGPIAKMTAGVYVPKTNRMFLFDMFGGRDARWMAGAARASQRSPDEIAFLLAHDNVATVIHEGIHQVAFNTGFHNRNVANPLWLVEGLATMMEVPELESKNRWAGVGQNNWDRVDQLRATWDQGGITLDRLLTDDLELRRPDTAQRGYSWAWALTYYLAKTRKKEFMDYVNRVNRRPILTEYSAADRLKDFRDAFDATPEEVEADLRRYIEKSVFKKKRPAP